MTKENVLYLKDLFYRIKQFYYGAGKSSVSNAGTDVGESTEYIAALQEAIGVCCEDTQKSRIPKDASVMLSSACHSIQAAMEDRNYRLAGDLAAAATRLCGVYMFPCLKRKKFWQKYILPLREKHEISLFAQEEEMFLSGRNRFLLLVPRFHTRSSGARYYEEDSDSEMKEAHPVIYTLFAVFGAFVLVSVIALYALTVAIGRRFGLFQSGGVSGAWILLGYAGAAAFGTGTFSLIMAWIHQYMGHVLTALGLVGGCMMMVASLFLL